MKTSHFDRLLLPDDKPLTFAELKMWAYLKRRLKYGPKMTKKQRRDYLLRMARSLQHK